MLNIVSATASMTTLIASGNITSSSNLPMISSKATRKTQSTGAYDLIFPDLHIDFPSRAEVQVCIDAAFKLHHSTIPHAGLFSSTGGATLVVPPTPIPRESMVGFCLVRAMSIVNAIGYEV